MDVLEPLPKDQWLLLLYKFRRNWPFYAQCYYWINNAIKWIKKDPRSPINIFCPNGNCDSGIFVGILTISENNNSVKKKNFCIITISTFENTKHLLPKILKETNVIDWSSSIYIVGIHQTTKDVLLTSLNELQACKRFKIEHVEESTFIFKPKEDCLKLTVDIPEECEIRHLDESHISLVHSLWRLRSKEYPELTKKYLETFVKYNRGVGLFLKKDNSLICWILHRDLGGLGMLQTVNEHRRKGYGKILVKAMVKQLAEEEDLDSSTFILEGNVPSQKLFMSLGYEDIASGTWVFVEPVAK